MLKVVPWGYEPFYDQLKQLGIRSLTREADYYGYALALGGAEVSLLELTNAYRTLANGGSFTPVTFNPSPVGEKDERAGVTKSAKRVINSAAAWIISDILADHDARSLTFGLDNALATPGWSAVKTGTSKDMRDNWCIGFSDRYTVGVWIGNASGEAMHNVSGVTGAAPVWQVIMSHLQQISPSRSPARPRGVVLQDVRFAPEVEPPRREAFIAGTEMSEVSLPEVRLARPRIIGPGDGATIAWDADTPASRQIIRLTARPLLPGSKWLVDGTEALAERDGSLHWQPVAGTHVLQLADEQGQLLDSMQLTVRGTVKALKSDAGQTAAPPSQN